MRGRRVATPDRRRRAGTRPVPSGAQPLYPAGMATLIVQTPEGVELRQELAGAGGRFAAALLDLLLFALVAALLGLVVIGVVAATSVSSGGFVAGLYLGGIVLLGLAYPFVFHVWWNGETPGKRMLRLRVVSADGSPATVVQHLLRSLLLLADILPLPIPLGLLLMAALPRPLRLGDLAAGTVVLRAPEPVPVREPWPGATWESLAEKRLLLGPAAAARLAPADRALLRNVAAREDVEDAVRENLVVETMKTYARRLGFAEPSGPAEAREALRELYVFARDHG